MGSTGSRCLYLVNFTILYIPQLFTWTLIYVFIIIIVTDLASIRYMENKYHVVMETPWYMSSWKLRDICRRRIFRKKKLVNVILFLYIFIFRLTICENNIASDELTSGYKSGQDVTKPQSEFLICFLVIVLFNLFLCTEEI